MHKIICCIYVIINFQATAYSSEKNFLKYEEVSKTILCTPTPQLKTGIAYSKWIKVKAELLAQNELDVFARESIEEIFNAIAIKKC